jgi:signal transduction histidine kinase
MHDVVSHQVSLIALQSGALRVTAADDATRQMAATIRVLANKTLDELRVMVGVLRGRRDELVPQPRLADLSQLVEDSETGAGLSLTGVAAREWPEPVERAVYRTVQEALTNIRKHAYGAAARVEVSATRRQLVVRVTNGPPPAPCPAADRDFPASGQGLIGLRERAELFGGQLITRTTAEGGFELCATFSWQATATLPGSDLAS